MRKDFFINYLNGNCSDEEFENFLAWIREESMSASGEKMVREAWDEFEPDTSVDNIKYDRLLDVIHHKINVNLDSHRPSIVKRPEGNSIWQVITRVAAILLLPVLSLLKFRSSLKC